MQLQSLFSHFSHRAAICLLSRTHLLELLTSVGVTLESLEMSTLMMMMSRQHNRRSFSRESRYLMIQTLTKMIVYVYTCLLVYKYFKKMLFLIILLNYSNETFSVIFCESYITLCIQKFNFQNTKAFFKLYNLSYYNAEHSWEFHLLFISFLNHNIKNEFLICKFIFIATHWYSLI